MISLTKEQTEFLSKVINDGIEEAVGSFNEMLESRISLEKESIVIFDPEKPDETLADLSDKEFASVLIRFSGIISGSSILTFSLEKASRLAVSLADEETDPYDLDELIAETLYEVGNIILSGILVYLANMLGTRLEHSVPEYTKGEIPSLVKQSGSEKIVVFLLVRTSFTVETPQIDGFISVVLEQSSLEPLLAAMEKYETR